MEDIVPNYIFSPKPFLHYKNKDKKPFQKEWIEKEKLDDDTRKELRRKKLFFSYKEPWVPGHRCMDKGKENYIEVLLNSDGEEEVRTCSWQ